MSPFASEDSAILAVSLLKLKETPTWRVESTKLDVFESYVITAAELAVFSPTAEHILEEVEFTQEISVAKDISTGIELWLNEEFDWFEEASTNMTGVVLVELLIGFAPLLLQPTVMT